MNLPNKLTLLRMFLVPTMIVLYLFINAIGNATYWIMGIIFVIASLTDYLDGLIARKFDLITTFGKFMDPLADKLLVISALVILSDNFRAVPSMWMPFWIPLIIIARELIVTSIRLVAVGEGKIIAASQLGKYKTAVTMMTIIWYFFLMPVNQSWIWIIGYCLIGLSVILTLISGIDYFLKNRKIILESI
ncbi:MAG: CDP-diacylglycerol--glycerol-3-phosphate 3-phosphatidyltransferase [Acholeplasmataceae bacterium]|nr:CDP-diacylglycerol--glycerol-3-phosphate 3-phosphatidyltransferase [Acholeplasmataceae bacterium]